MTRQEPASAGLLTDDLPRWDVTDLHESFTARSFLDALDRLRADAGRLEALFDEHGIRAEFQRFGGVAGCAEARVHHDRHVGLFDDDANLFARLNSAI